MYSYEWDSATGGYILQPEPLPFSKEPRPVYYKELDILGFDKHWNYDKNDAFPYMWAEANKYYYRVKCTPMFGQNNSNLISQCRICDII